MMLSINNKINCERRINIEYLIDGYLRENSKNSKCYHSFIPKSVTEVILYYHPKMSGHTFIWKIDEMKAFGKR